MDWQLEEQSRRGVVNRAWGMRQTGCVVRARVLCDLYTCLTMGRVSMNVLARYESRDGGYHPPLLRLCRLGSSTDTVQSKLCRAYLATTGSLLHAYIWFTMFSDNLCSLSASFFLRSNSRSHVWEMSAANGAEEQAPGRVIVIVGQG